MSNWYSTLKKDAFNRRDLMKGLLMVAPAAAAILPTTVPNKPIAAPTQITRSTHPSTRPTTRPTSMPSTRATSRPTTVPSTQPEQFQKHIRYDEHEVNHVYPDPIHDKDADPNDPASWNVPTIGVGHAIDRSHIDKVLMGILENNRSEYDQILADNKNLSESQLKTLLESDVIRTEKGVKAVCQNQGIDYDNLSPTVKEVLLNMGFQMGAQLNHKPHAKQHGLAALHTFLQAVKTQHWDEAIKAMLSSKWGSQQTPQRAYRLAKLIATEFGIPLPPPPPRYSDYPK